MVAAGKFNRRVTIEQITSSRDGIGGEIETWSTFATVWAEFVSQSSRKFVAAKQVHSELTALIRIRYRSGITAQMRVRYGSRIFQLVAAPINVKEGGESLELMCREIDG